MRSWLRGVISIQLTQLFHAVSSSPACLSKAAARWPMQEMHGLQLIQCVICLHMFTKSTIHCFCWTVFLNLGAGTFVFSTKWHHRNYLDYRSQTSLVLWASLCYGLSWLAVYSHLGSEVFYMRKIQPAAGDLEKLVISPPEVCKNTKNHKKNSTEMYCRAFEWTADENLCTAGLSAAPLFKLISVYLVCWYCTWLFLNTRLIKPLCEG